MPANILQEIVRQKKIEVDMLYQTYHFGELLAQSQPSPLSFYQKIEKKAKANEPFIISEFKRKSPSEGWINRQLAVPAQVSLYASKGASAVSVLTDEPYFGGTYEDLSLAVQTLEGTGVLVLQKDFIIDPIQIYLGRAKGANMILLIAAILSKEEMLALKTIAESLNMGVLAEVHSVEEYEKIADLNFPVVGVNNRDLTNFKTALNCCNYIAQHVTHNGYMIAESGMASSLDLRIAQQNAQGFLIGTSLMRQAQEVPFEALSEKRYFLKACGIRTATLLDGNIADLIGINFSPISKRRGAEGWLEGLHVPANAVAVFKNNSAEEVLTILEKHKFRYVQLYADDFEVDFVKTIKQKVILAIAVKTPLDIAKADAYAPYIDLFILDGAVPGSGESISFSIPGDFPYPFLLAGGMNATNLERLLSYKNCIGADMASGIETDKQVDNHRIKAVQTQLSQLLSLQPTSYDK